MRFYSGVERMPMQRYYLVLLFSATAAILPAGAFARGETSSVLPEVRETVPPAADVVSTPLWSHPVANESENMLAIGSNGVAFAAPDRMCGFDAVNGAQLWCDGKGQRPAYADGVVAYTAADGSVHGVDIHTGALLWRRPGAVSQYVTASYAASTGEDFILSGWRGPVHPGAMSSMELLAAESISYAEVTPSGTLLWAGEGHNCCSLPSPEIIKPYAFQINTGSGATIMSSLQILKLGHGGGVRAAIHNTGDVLDFDAPTITLGGGWRGQEMEDNFLTFDVEKADVVDGAVIATYHYEPDYDANYNRYEHAYFANNPLYAARIRVDGDFIYALVYGNVYRYRLAEAAGQRPLLVASDAVLLGGPYRGAVYISQVDGVWALRIGAAQIGARLVAPSSSQVAGFSIAGKTAYIAFADGELRGVDVNDGHTVLDARPGNAARVGVGHNRVFVVCHSDAGWKVIAYRRPDLP